MRILVCCLFVFGLSAADPLPSWNDGPTKTALLAAIKDHVAKVPVADRIAVFDNDGTLWAEQPGYFQALYMVDYINTHAAEHPDWQTTEPFAGVLQGHFPHDAKQILQLAAATHAGRSVADFQAEVRAWFATARHPRFQRPYHELVYQPMLELLAHLRAQEFQCWIVSGGGVDFLRCFASDVYDIPPERMIGSTLKSSLVERDGKLVLMKDAGIRNINDKEGKVVNINIRLGRQPVLAVGNSDGDFAMMRACVEAGGTALLIHHDDAEREWAYDRESSIGKLDACLDWVQERGVAGGCIRASMKNDFATVFPAKRD